MTLLDKDLQDFIDKGEGYHEQRTYRCVFCKRWFKRTPGVVCAVLHPPGTCCHYKDKEIKPKKDVI